jgi:hypothetical protein
VKKSPKPPLLLNQVLFPFGLSVNILSNRTSISAERLEQMYAQGDATQAEMESVARELERPKELITWIFAHQAGNYNQAGSNQRQKVNSNNKRSSVRIKNLNVYIQVVSPSSTPAADDPNSLAEYGQQQDNNCWLPSDQNHQVGRSLTSGTHGF